MRLWRIDRPRAGSPEATWYSAASVRRRRRSSSSYDGVSRAAARRPAPRPRGLRHRRESGRPVELARGRLGGLLGAEGEMVRSLLGIVGRGRQAPVGLPPFPGERRFVRDRGQQGVREAKSKAVQLEDRLVKSLGKPLRTPCRALDEIACGVGGRGGEQDRVIRLGREGVEAGAEQRAEALGDRQGHRIRRSRVTRCNACDLERVERIASRDPGQLEQSWPREAQIEARAQETIQIADGKRPDLDHGETLPVERSGEPERLCRLAGASAGNEEADREIDDPSCYELEHAPARGIQPLDVVDRDQGRPLAGELSDEGERCTRDGETAESFARLDPRERRLEHGPLRWDEGGKHPVEDGIEEIAQRHERKRRLGLRGSAGEHGVVAVARIVDRLEPDRRLAHPGFTVEDEACARRGSIQERRNGVPFRSTTNDDRRHWLSLWERSCRPDAGGREPVAHLQGSSREIVHAPEHAGGQAAEERGTSPAMPVRSERGRPRTVLRTWRPGHGRGT